MTQTDELTGRELDAAVARAMGHEVYYNDSKYEVMMWHAGADAPAIYPVGYSIVDGVGYAVGSSIGQVFPVPRYSSDPAAMMDVIERLRQRWGNVFIHVKAQGQVTVSNRDAYDQRYTEAVIVEGATLSEAVAHAALAALTERGEGE